MAVQTRALSSSAIQQIYFDFETEELWIVFNKTKIYPTYHYEGVPSSVVVGLMNAGSAGKYFHKHIDGQYESEAFHGPSVNNRIQKYIDMTIGGSNQIDIQKTGRWN